MVGIALQHAIAVGRALVESAQEEIGDRALIVGLGELRRTGGETGCERERLFVQLLAVQGDHPGECFVVLVRVGPEPDGPKGVFRQFSQSRVSVTEGRPTAALFSTAV